MSQQTLSAKEGTFYEADEQWRKKQIVARWTLWGLSVFCVFILIPRMCSPRVIGFSVPDPIWISLMIAIPVVIAIYLLEQKAHIPAKYVWVGIPVQFLILVVFAGPISKISPLSSDEWTYIGAVLVWPLSVTAAQFVSLIALRTWKAKRAK